jgi:hypothetical protein
MQHQLGRQVARHGDAGLGRPVFGASSMTTGPPFWPAAPWWMCAAVAVLNLSASIRSKSWLWPGFSVPVKLPVASSSPAGLQPAQ